MEECFSSAVGSYALAILMASSKLLFYFWISKRENEELLPRSRWYLFPFKFFLHLCSLSILFLPCFLYPLLFFHVFAVLPLSSYALIEKKKISSVLCFSDLSSHFRTLSYFPYVLWNEDDFVIKGSWFMPYFHFEENGTVLDKIKWSKKNITDCFNCRCRYCDTLL